MQVEVGILFSTAVAMFGIYATINKIQTENKKNTEQREQSIESETEKREQALAKEKEEQTKRHIELKYSLENLGVTMHQVALDMRSMDGKFEQLDRKVVVLEESSKSAHKRIDTIEKKCENRHDMRPQHG